MDINAILNTVFQFVIIPLLPVLVGYFIKWVNSKAEELKQKTNNDNTKKYIGLLNDTITAAVVMVNQTYVNSLKEAGNFGVDAQKEAFKRVYNTVLLALTEEARFYLNEAIGDLETYITTKIEQEVNYNKITPTKEN